MVKHKAKERRLNTKFIYACALIVLFTIFSAVYVKGVIGTQFGWWHYYAWRMKEGDVLYKDIYLFMPPYFVFFTRLFYTFFSNHLIFYTICQKETQFRHLIPIPVADYINFPFSANVS